MEEAPEQTTRATDEAMDDAVGTSSEEEDEEGDAEVGVRSSHVSTAGYSYFLIEFYFQLDEFFYEVTYSNFKVATFSLGSAC